MVRLMKNDPLRIVRKINKTMPFKYIMNNFSDKSIRSFHWDTINQVSKIYKKINMDLYYHNPLKKRQYEH